jgi:GNAT superfamily N-acetyltransferase
MDIEIRELSPTLLDDYLNYFDRVAFTDHPEWSGCYCVHFHWNDSLELQSNVLGGIGEKTFNRKLAANFISNGTINGYLAYLDGTVVGWCNANDKSAFDGLAKEKCPELWDDSRTSYNVKSVVCFLISPDMRGKGIATQLLNRVCLDAAAQGFSYVEAYPHLNESDTFVNHHGPYSLYHKSGFILYKDLNGPVIVRKYL